MRRLLVISLLMASVAVSAAPPPPPSAAEAQFYEDFFSALPSSFPERDVERLEEFVAPELVVFFEGEQRFDSRDAWLTWLNEMAVERGVERTSMTREEFFFQSGDRILVREFWYPYRKGTSFHPAFPHKLVSYQFKDKKLVRVDYLAQVRPMETKPGAKSGG